MWSSLVIGLPILLSFLTSSANAQAGTFCNSTLSCPAATPCCSEYGYCGTGTYCYGGCNPLWSHSLSSCAPNPVCEDATLTFTNFDRILQNASLYDGNATDYDWILDAGNIMSINSPDGDLVLVLTEANGGTLVSSTRYVHYGTITTRLKTGRWGGVVTAFITMSDVRDEIDWEFPGDATTEGQTNYFWQGYVPANSNGEVETGLTDTYENFHDYTIDWQAKTLTFSIDGNVVRTVNEADTVDKSGVSHYPNTPSRIQLSIWPAGLSSEAQGTIEWGGGLINWQDPDYLAAGYFSAMIDSVNITCADQTSRVAGVTAYTYGTNATSLTPSIELVDGTSVLLSSGASASKLGRPYSFRATLVTVVGLILVALIP